MRMDAGKQMLDVILRGFRHTPAVSVNVGGHGAVDPMSEGLREPLRLAVIPQKEVEIRELGHIEIGSGQFDVATLYRLLKSCFSAGVAASRNFYGPEGLASPAERFPFRALPALCGFRDVSAWRIKSTWYCSILLAFRVADIRGNDG